jgi:hypothetical protein
MIHKVGRVRPGEPPNRMHRFVRLTGTLRPTAPPRFRAPIRVRKVEVVATHDPNPLLIPSFSSTGGEGARRAVEGDSQRFKAPTHVRIWKVFAFHEPVRLESRLQAVRSAGPAKAGTPNGPTSALAGVIDTIWNRFTFVRAE